VKKETSRTKRKRVPRRPARRASFSTPALMKAIKKTLKRTVPLSIPIKVVLLTGAVYISTLVITNVVLSLLGISLSSIFLGVQVRVIIWGVHIFLIAAVATISTNLFLDRPLDALNRVMSRAEKGDFLIRVPESGDDELGVLTKNFNHMLAHITNLTATKIQAEQDLLFAQRELRLKGQLAEQSKTIKENNKMLEALVKDLQLLYEIGQNVNSTIDLDELYCEITKIFQDRLKLDKFAIMVKEEAGEFMQVKAAYGFEETDHILDMTFRIGEGVTGEAASLGETVYVKDTTREDRFLHYKGERVIEGSFLSTPLIYKKDILGVINFHRPKVDSFSDEEIRLLTLVASQIALAVENAKLYTKARELSVKDDLTGLYNRRHFQTVLQVEWKRAIRFHRSLSLLMIDVDFFKKYNDTFGHLHGDKVLKELSNVLRRNIREIDTVARFGGEEFIILLPDTDKRGAIAVGEKLRKIVETHRFAEPASGGAAPQITVSVGIAAYPDDVREMDDLIDHADIALYDAKDAGRNRVVCYPQLTLPTSLDAVRSMKRPNMVS